VPRSVMARGGSGGNDRGEGPDTWKLKRTVVCCHEPESISNRHGRGDSSWKERSKGQVAMSDGLRHGFSMPGGIH